MSSNNNKSAILIITSRVSVYALDQNLGRRAFNFSQLGQCRVDNVISTKASVDTVIFGLQLFFIWKEREMFERSICSWFSTS